MRNALCRIPVVALVLLALAAGAGHRTKPQLKLVGKPARDVDSLRYLPASDMYQVTVGKVQHRFRARDVEWARGPKPADLDQAVRTKNTKRLEEIANSNRRLWWDRVALRHLVTIYAEQQDHERQVRVFERLRAMPGKLPLDLQRSYLQALLRLDRSAQVRREVVRLMQGDREEAALAGIVRGDLLLDDGDEHGALVDGYLRTAVLFRDVGQFRREALEKSIKVLELMRDARAEKLRQQLVREFPEART